MACGSCANVSGRMCMRDPKKLSPVHQPDEIYSNKLLFSDYLVAGSCRHRFKSFNKRTRISHVLAEPIVAVNKRQSGNNKWLPHSISEYVICCCRYADLLKRARSLTRTVGSLSGWWIKLVCLHLLTNSSPLYIRYPERFAIFKETVVKYMYSVLLAMKQTKRKHDKQYW